MTTFYSHGPTRVWLRDGTEVEFKSGSYKTTDRAHIKQLRGLGYTEKKPKAELKAKAKRLDIEGRSDMTRDELEQAVEEHTDDLAAD